MEPMAAGSMDGLTSHRCCLPVSGRERVSAAAWQSIPIKLPLLQDNPQVHTQRAVADEESVLSCWAVLLRSYTGSDLVSFVEVFDQHDVQLDDGDSRLEIRLTRIEARLVQYQISDSLALKHVRVAKSQLPWGYSSEIQLVNTAVRFREELYTEPEDISGKTWFKQRVAPVSQSHVGETLEIFVCLFFFWALN